MALHWSGLGEVALVSVGTTVGVVTVFALGVRLLASREPAGAGTPPAGRVRAGRPTALSKAVAGLCFLACGAVIGYGLYLLVPQLH
ncbi:hypothetical protein [Streptomyces sp. NPDC051569]|uniref:hypothetical protein n=1 Tax=Streptomyces sp. NPDC051569 TaxID=3365661 RepID=UPI0037BA869F